MAAKFDGKNDGCTFLWKIENISHCWWVKNSLAIVSPSFIADPLDGTKWILFFQPMNKENQNYIALYLQRGIDSSEPKSIEINFQLAVLDKHGSIVTKRSDLKRNFKKSFSWGFPTFETREKLFITKREVFLPEDTLTIQCTLWNKEDKPINPKCLYARTVYKVRRRSLIWKINQISSLKSNVINTFKDSLIDFNLVLSQDENYEKKLVITINSYIESIKYFSCMISIVDSEVKKENCGKQEYFSSDFEKGELTAQLFAKTFTENNTRYMPNDVLSLDCEYVVCTKNNFYEFFGTGNIIPRFENKIAESTKENLTEALIQNSSTEKEKSPKEELLANGLKFMFNDALFSDTELRTSTRNFPAHKGILSARSPVFRSMFSHDMKEKNSGHIDVIDFDDDTIHRMLLFIYTDSLDDLQFERASMLYRIADKYQIQPLKFRCSSFLKDNFNATNICDVLVLADMHHDDDLKSVAQDYILGKRKEIFCSLEWKHFMDSHLKLAADVMYRKIYEE